MARSPDPFDDLDEEEDGEEGGDFDVDDFGTGEGNDFGIPDSEDEDEDDDDDDEGDDGIGGDDDFDFRDDDDDDDFDDFDLGSFDDDDDDDDDEGGLSRPLIGLIAASLVFIVLVASLVGWLMISFDPEEQDKALETAQVITALAPPPKPKAKATPKPQPAKTAKAEANTRPKPTAGSTAGDEPSTGDEPAKTAADSEEPTAISASGKKSKASKAPTSAPVIKKTIKEEKVEVAAVDPELIDETTSGPLPKIAPDGRQAWQVYARPFTAPAKDKKIGKVAVVLAGLGLSRTQTLAAIQQLPGAVTLSFAPYARNLGDWIAQSRAAGHEVLLELPMEPYDYPDNDPGPHTLLTTLSTPDNMDRLNWLLGRFPGYVGVTNYMGAKFMTNETKLLPIIQNLKERGLLYLDAKADRKSVAARVAKELQVPIAANNRFIDREASRVSIDARLYELERISKSVGSAVGIAFPYPVSVERLKAWIATLHKKGIVLAPITAIANTQPIR